MDLPCPPNPIASARSTPPSSISRPTARRCMSGGRCASRATPPSLAALRRHIDARLDRLPALPSPRRGAGARARRPALGRRRGLRRRTPRPRAASRAARRAATELRDLAGVLLAGPLDPRAPALADDARDRAAGRGLRAGRAGPSRARRRRRGARGRGARPRPGGAGARHAGGRRARRWTPGAPPSVRRGARRTPCAGACSGGAQAARALPEATGMARAAGRLRPPGRADGARALATHERRTAFATAPLDGRARRRAPSRRDGQRRAARGVGGRARRRAAPPRRAARRGPRLVPASTRGDDEDGDARQPDLVPRDRPPARRAGSRARPAHGALAHACAQARRRRGRGRRAAAVRRPAAARGQARRGPRRGPRRAVHARRLERHRARPRRSHCSGAS